MAEETVLFEGDTAHGHYIVADTLYGQRPARVLYSGNHHAAQSGIARDDKDELLFDYNERFRELVRGLRPKRLLMIGGGAFTLPRTLSQEFPEMYIDIIELDVALVDIAEAYFDFKPQGRMKVFAAEGSEFLKNTAEHRYDMILIDAFIHDVVPKSLQSVEAARELKRNLRPGGVVAMNLIAAYYGQRSAALRRQIASLQTCFSALELFPASREPSLWIPQNFIVTAQNDHRELAEFVRYQPLDLPAA